MGSLTKAAEEGPSAAVDWSDEAVIYVNGVRRVLPDGLAHLTLLQYLRDIGLQGTKLGCGEGGCGACTVMVSCYDQTTKKSQHYAINACLAPLYSLEGMHIITVEGIGDRQRGLHPVQERLAKAHGSQCGFCTPGFVMSMYALLRSSKHPPTEEQIEDSLAGNLCRCTGYRPIIDAFRVFAKTDDSLYTASPSENANGQAICPSTGKPCSCRNETDVNANESSTLSSVKVYLPCSYNEIDGNSYSEKELIFPPELQLRKFMPLKLNGFNGIRWYRPLKLEQLLYLRSCYPDAKLIIGNSEVGVETKFKNAQYKVMISVTHVPELHTLKVEEHGLHIGSAVRLAQLQKFLKNVIAERGSHETSSCHAILRQLKWFAGTQIRNVASVGGNICTASPISDLNPLWMATGANFQIIDVNNNVRTTAAKDFFLGYRKVDLKADEILLSVILPWTRPYEYVKEFKQAHRREDDIALVNAGMRMHITEAEGNWIVSDVSIVYGGVAVVPLTAAKTEKFLVGKKLDDGLLDETFNLLKEDIPLAENAPGGMVEFRSSLTLSFFFKFFLYVTHEMNIKGLRKVGLDAANMSAIQSYTRPVSIGTQGYESVGQGTAVGQPMVHMSAMLQVTGEAEYVDDTPTPPNNLHAALVLSKKAHARILSIDDSVAKCSPGFAGVFLSKDVPGSNHIGPIIHDEEVFASDVVTCVGQIIGIVVADTHDNAKAAANKVNIEYSELPAILSISEAVKAGSFHPNTTRCLSNGDVEQCFASNTCDKIIEGEIRVGGQEHFYMEPQCTFVWPVDSGNEIHMISSTQAPQKHQKYVANALGLPLSKVVCKTKRIGGGFGGKETRSAIFAAAASVASYCLRRPVKIVLDRDVDMITTGQRHSFLGKYKLGFTNDGKIQALDLEIYNNGGNSLDLSLAVLERAVFHSENVYAIPNIRVSGKVCFTNFPSNTAFRGFGGPQGMLIAENWIHHMATELKRSPEEIKELNFQSEGTELYYGQLLKNCTMHSVWDELKASCNILEARKAVNVFNSENRWRKRGIAMVPTKFGISFTAKFMNQAGALVQVYTDGTVLVTHGGVEMGQGLHTKIAQVAASSLDIPLSCVFISETSTDKVPNASPTAASASSDLYGAAVLDACQQIKARMEPIASRGNHKSFAELAQACYMERVDLSAHGFYITPDIGFDWIAGKGSPFNYFTYGAAFAEVEIDTLTGDFHTRTADIVMDLGYSINPAIDIGQIEGAFIQGLGWAAMEELKWGDDNHKWIRPGYLFTCGPGSYKIPSVNDIPLNFKVSLLKGVPNPRAIHSSKAVGEPPFFLASAILFAIKDAIAAARAEEGHLDWFPLDNPATPERIRMACVDSITKKFASVYYRPKLSV
ncbi:xanthine dehydrogenase [Aegilops tauschii subsp. strangulata]|uniref:xanthine dehydrogenase n=5 Tax=Aegilops tauschii subsp. strangulata TaxID=200361 RepID=A0A452YPL8_AEGTS|nr:xanthine dehydrogenase [Aegilops tauschii subsp. strangulata]